MAGFISGIGESGLSRKTGKASLVEFDEQDNIAAVLSFQYFPETITDSRSSRYNAKDVAGGSLPLQQWGGGGERTISFTAVFSCDADLVGQDAAVIDAHSTNTGAFAFYQRLRSSGHALRNPDLRVVISWLRRFTLPTYSQTADGGAITFAPRKVGLMIRNGGLGIAGGGGLHPDMVLSVMTQCDVSYEAFFASNLPRLATVQLTLTEVPQFRGGVLFPSRGAVDRAFSGVMGSSESSGSGKYGGYTEYEDRFALPGYTDSLFGIR